MPWLEEARVCSTQHPGVPSAHKAERIRWIWGRTLRTHSALVFNSLLIIQEYLRSNKQGNKHPHLWNLNQFFVYVKCWSGSKYFHSKIYWFCLFSVTESKGRMKRRNVVHGTWLIYYENTLQWKISLSSKFNFHSPLDPCYFCPTQTSCLVSRELMTCLQLQLIVISHQKNHIIFSETSLCKGLWWTLKVGLSTHTHRVLQAHTPPVFKPKSASSF